MLDRLPDGVLALVLQHTASENARVAQVSRGVRRQVANAERPTPLNFRVLLGQYPGLTQPQRRASMLTALEAQGRLHELHGIAVPDFELDGPGPAGYAYERGAVRLAAVVQQHAATLRTLDVAGAAIVRWRELDAALRACVALQRVNLSGSVFGTGNTPFAGLALCHQLRELHVNDCYLDRDAERLVPVLRNCQRLERLDLGRNDLSAIRQPPAGGPAVYDFEHVTSALRHHQSLRELLLSKVDLNRNCCIALAGCLRTLLALERLDVSSNLINEAKMLELEPGLAACAALRHLSLHSNPDLSNTSLIVLLGSGCVRRLASLDLSNPACAETRMCLCSNLLASLFVRESG
jgi:hypothetical protein